MDSSLKWENMIEPQSELIGYLANPQFYAKYKETKDKAKTTGDITYKNKDSSGGAGASTAVFDPALGLVDENGAVLVPLNVLQQNNPEFQDMMISR